MIVVQGWMRVHPDDAGKLREAAQALAQGTRQESGNVAYSFAEDVNEAGLFHVAERWADESSMAAHMGAPAMQAFMPSLVGLRDMRLWFARYDGATESVIMQV